MTQETLVLGLALDAIAGFAFAAVGAAVSTHGRSHREGRALRLFALFWIGIAVGQATDVMLTIMALAGAAPLGLVQFVMHARIVTSLIAFLGITYYLAYMYRGNPRILPGFILAYVLVFGLVEYVALGFGLRGVDAQPWRGWYSFDRLPSGPVYSTSVVVTWIPPLILGLAYGSLARRVEDPGARYRVLLLSASIVLFFLGNLIGFLDYESPTWGFAKGIVGTVSGLLALAGVRPPAWARRRFGATTLADATPFKPPEAALSRAKLANAELAKRVRELV